MLWTSSRGHAVAKLAGDYSPDVLVVGGGIAGLAAALRLQDHGSAPLVLEAEARVGGRMTTDRVGGFVIDRGVTLIGNRFRRMRRLAMRLGLREFVRPVPFTLGIQTQSGLRFYRAQRPDDMLLSQGLSLAGRLACSRFLWDLVRESRSLLHGHSDRCAHLDLESSEAYVQRLGQGGDELFRTIIAPGMEALLGGSLAEISRAVMMQVTWNTIAGGLWNFTSGVDCLPRAIAKHVPVVTEACATQVRFDDHGAEVDVERAGRKESFSVRGVIVAVPGHRVDPLCPQLPGWLAEPLTATRYTQRVVAHVALEQPPEMECAGYAFPRGHLPGVGAVELQHHRAPGRCPEGKGMVSVYFEEEFVHQQDDAGVQRQAIGAVEQLFPETRGATLFVHLLRWEAGTGFFPVGRLRQVVEVRRRLADWQAPIEFAGDYLDGVSSEGALSTGEQAADRLVKKLQRRPARSSREDISRRLN